MINTTQGNCDIAMVAPTIADGDWYSSMTSQQRMLADSMAKWTEGIPWQLFVTLTFPWNVRGDTADAKLYSLLGTLGESMKTPICYLAGKERKPRSFGMEVRWHFHVLMTASSPISPDQVASLWKKLAGKGATTILKPEGDSVDVRLFDKGKRGVEYCLKMANRAHGEWSHRWLELFSPNIRASGRMNHRNVRQRRRGALRAALVG